MIHHLYHFHKSGLVLTSVGFGSTTSNVSPELVSGFLSALRMFGQDLLEDDVTTIETGNYQFVWDFRDPVLSVALTDRTDDSVAIMAVLKTLNALFVERFQKQLRRWTGEVAPFREFNPIIREVIRDYLPSFEKPKDNETLRPAIIRLWRLFGEGLDTILYGLIAGIPLMVVGRKSRNQSVIRALQTLEMRRIPIMWFDDAGAALQVLKTRPPYLSFIISLPRRAYEATFSDAASLGLTHVALLVKDCIVKAIGFDVKSLRIARAIEHAEIVLGKQGTELRNVADTAYQTTKCRINEVAKFLAENPTLPDNEGATLLRIPEEDFLIFKELADHGGYLRRERKRVIQQVN